MEPEAEDKVDREFLKGTWWFPQRKYMPGWGLPVCWQGWLVFVGYFALLVGPSPFLLPAHPQMYLAYGAALTAALIAVCWKKGEPFR